MDGGITMIDTNYTKRNIIDEIMYLEKRIDNLSGDYSRTQQLRDAKFSLNQLIKMQNEGETEVMAEYTHIGNNYDYVRDNND
jgi:hypothetical protein